MNFIKIKDCDIANGKGVRVSLFIAGCDKHCPGCFNPETWTTTAGELYTPHIQTKILDLLGRPYIKGLTLIGGEPLQPNNIQTLIRLCDDINTKFNSGTKTKDIWCYTGHTWENLMRYVEAQPELRKLLSQLDVVVDGPFIQDLADPALAFRGSSNQRIINPKESLKLGVVSLYS